MSSFSSCVPSIDERYSNQTELSSISDEEFADAWQPRPFKWYHRVFQIVCFIVFLGPIRVAFSLFMTLITISLIYIIRGFLHVINAPADFGKKFCTDIASVAFRFLFFAFGHIHIKLNGKVDPEARIVIANHTALHDPFVIVCIRYITSVMKAELSQKKLYMPILECVDPIFVDRSKSTGVSQQIIDHADNFNRPPVLIFPEGTLNNGDVLLKFHRGAFLTPYKVQPFCIRYWQPLVPKGWNTYAWTTNSIVEYIWGLVSMPPFSIIEVDALPSITMGNEGKGDIETCTLKAQLIMANHMKVKAVDRSSDEIFKHKKPKTEIKETNDRKKKKD
ncbi:Acyltransferase family protein [Tritrichomonas foetus]|uniref:Acyltransferase family protein n=1 Tax=Tritrichomonas foetus TaxID=1144522 RepID=A0A1J4JH28_9EUKA|nr:Acyltransferase family protein [Tritrichomonas foetus]|eukprot:OHS98446.1 Acyltransferase family protein [Tritrichomonas foetus]